MIKIVIDSNIAFSAILNVNSTIGQLLISIHKQYDFYAPEYIRTELLDYKDKIKEIANFTEKEFLETYELVVGNITILNHSILPLKFYKQAAEICHSIDPDDTVFVAFAEFLNAKLWTGDKKLIKGLVEKGFMQCITTQALYQNFINKEPL